MTSAVGALAAQVNRIGKHVGSDRTYSTELNVLDRGLADDALRFMQSIILGSGEPDAMAQFQQIAGIRASDPVSYVSPRIAQITTSLSIYGDSMRLPKVPASVAPPPLPGSTNVPSFVDSYVKNNPIPVPWDGWMYTGAIALGLAAAIGASVAAKRLGSRRG